MSLASKLRHITHFFFLFSLPPELSHRDYFLLSEAVYSLIKNVNIDMGSFLPIPAAVWGQNPCSVPTSGTPLCTPCRTL